MEENIYKEFVDVSYELDETRMSRNIWRFVAIMIIIAFGVLSFMYLYPTFKSPSYQIRGTWLKNYNYSEAMDNVYSREPNGRWICVNINGLSYDKMMKTIQHEVGHELFAQKCENNITKCIEAVS